MNRFRILKLAALAAATTFVLAACQSGGLSSEDADDIAAQLEGVNQNLNAIESTVEEHADDADNGDELVQSVQEEVSQARSTIADVEDQLAPPPPPEDDLGGGDPGGMPGGF
ncbi:MAG TPA: hypothetical protein VK092_06020 [Deinococcales bacterium]|nr:hypothetical protein [Deinococcales bacterium]